MTLFEAKDAARKESRATKGKIFFVTVDPKDGECDLTSNQKTKELVAHAYKNGSEIAVPLEMNQVSEPANADANEATTNSNNKTMAKKAAAKKGAKAPKAKKEKTPRKWNPEPQFGFSAEAWKKLIAIGAKEGGLSFVQLMRKAVADKYKVGE